MKRILSFVMAAVLVSMASAQTPAPAPSADAFYRQGQAAEKAGDPAAAQKAYLEALKLDPGHANARYSLGQLKLTAAERAFFKTVRAAVVANPFSAERLELDAAIVGLAPTVAAADVIEAVIRRVNAHADQMERAGRADFRKTSDFDFFNSLPNRWRSGNFRGF